MDELALAKATALKALTGSQRVNKKRRKKKRQRGAGSALSGNVHADYVLGDGDIDWVAAGVADGLESEQLQEMATALDDRFGVTVPRTEISDAPEQPQTKEANGELPKDERMGDDTDDDSPMVADRAHASKVTSGRKLPKLSRRQRKEALHMSVAELKTTVDDPAAVEPWDVNSSDPRLHVQLKSMSNAVPVPLHWRNKRAYLQNKRGLEKRPYQLPQFLQETGVAKMREAHDEMEQNKSLKQKSRDKVRPKMGKVDIDYQVLHDAFFKFQTKPRLTSHGDLYYELREMEPDYHSSFRPGFMSSELRVALGMDQARSAPPPWLINMQRVGPPPAYPNLKIPGLNAPIPPGASFGYHAGGWGRPPVDAYGNALYGDIFGSGPTPADFAKTLTLTNNERGKLWGNLGDYDDSEAESAEGVRSASGDDEEDSDIEVDADASGTATELDPAGTESTFTAINSGGLVTPADAIQLRKGAAHQVIEHQPPPKGSPPESVALPTHRYKLP